MTKPFPAARIAAIRWLDLGVSTAAADTAAEAADATTAHAVADGGAHAAAHAAAGGKAAAKAGKAAAKPGKHAAKGGKATAKPGKPAAKATAAKTAATERTDMSGTAGAAVGGAAGAAGAAAGCTPESGSPISDAARELIIAAEVSSEAAYKKRYCKPEWPQGASGVTIGIGYDCGYATAAQLRQDWHALPAAMVEHLVRTVGVTGGPAGPLARQLRDSVNVPWENALSVFDHRDIPRWVGIVRKALPNTELLSPDCLGALVSLAYNRGASFSKSGDRYAEMRAIKAHMANKAFSRIPAEFRSMKRLWPSMRGLRDRREDEAKLFEQGLATMH